MEFKPQIDRELAYELYVALGELLVDSQRINPDNDLEVLLNADQVENAWNLLNMYRMARHG